MNYSKASSGSKYSVRLNSPKGLGDALHVRVIALYHLKRGADVTVYTKWPEIFSDLDVAVNGKDELPKNGDYDACSACFQCQVPFVRSVSQFRGICLQAGIYEEIDLELAWSVRNHKLIADVRGRSRGLPILFWQPVKQSANDAEAEGRPERAAFASCVNSFSGHFKVKLGHPNFLDDDGSIASDLDLFGRISTTDAIDLISIANLVVCEPSFLGIAAQAFDKRLVCMFSRRGLQSRNKRISGVTPTKIFHKPEISTAIFDDE